MDTLFDFPDPVNETSARLVAAGVVIQVVVFLLFREGWMLVALVYGFLARALTGPTLSPLGQFVTRVDTPRIRAEHRFVPGPQKRFAQGIGLTYSATAALASAVGVPSMTYVELGLLAIAASLEAALALCLGCVAYRLIWECDDCTDISDRLRTALAASAPATN